jgi:phosphate transport system permease protein
LAHAAAWVTLGLLVAIIGSLVVGAWPSIKEYGLSFLWRTEWDPVKDSYGGLVMIYGTLMTSFIALLIAVPGEFRHCPLPDGNVTRLVAPPSGHGD